MQIVLKLNYIQMKRMKKLYGRKITREIATGRKLIRFMKREYDRKEGQF
jgi:hypothetical protein